MKFIPVLCFFLCFSACTPYVSRGSFAIISTKPIESNFQVISTKRVDGRACFNQLKAQLFIADGVFEVAIANAIAKHEGATLLISAEIKDEGKCVSVSGLPAKEKQ